MLERMGVGKEIWRNKVEKGLKMMNHKFNTFKNNSAINKTNKLEKEIEK